MVGGRRSSGEYCQGFRRVLAAVHIPGDIGAGGTADIADNSLARAETAALLLLFAQLKIISRI